MGDTKMTFPLSDKFSYKWNASLENAPKNPRVGFGLIAFKKNTVAWLNYLDEFFDILENEKIKSEQELLKRIGPSNKNLKLYYDKIRTIIGGNSPSSLKGAVAQNMNKYKFCLYYPL